MHQVKQPQPQQINKRRSHKRSRAQVRAALAQLAWEEASWELFSTEGRGEPAHALNSSLTRAYQIV